MDGLRTSLCLKGSAGLKPCLRCLNAVKKDSGLDPERYLEISEHCFEKFRAATNEDIFALADALKNYVDVGATKKTVENFEKAAGLVFFEDGLFFRPDLRGRLPPCSVCVDGMHAYFSNGCASWEVALCMAAVHKHAGWTLRAISDAALASQWTGPKCSQHVYKSYMTGLFNEKNFTETLYKGKASQTESVVPLLRYYFEEGGLAHENLKPYLKSYGCLADCVAALRKLRYQWTDVTAEDVTTLQHCQEIHQQHFVACYSEDLVKPKHHHRLHLPSAFVKMQVALRCETHESKHRNYKHGLAERMTSLVHEGFQKSILPRLLQGQAQRVQEAGLKPLQVLPPFKDADVYLKSVTGDLTLQTAKALKYNHSTVHVKDILFFADGTAGVVQDIAFGREQHYFWLQQLRPLRQATWGNIWQCCDQHMMVPALRHSWTMPGWWRWNDNVVTCLG
eukprot:s395_g9.t1